MKRMYVNGERIEAVNEWIAVAIVMGENALAPDDTYRGLVDEVAIDDFAASPQIVLDSHIGAVTG